MVIWEWAGMIGSILVLDLALSGDNALVLGATAAGLPHKQRWYALFFGGAGAILFRVIFSSIATIVLNIPWLQTLGAVVLLVIAVRLLAERNQAAEGSTEHEQKHEHAEEHLTGKITRNLQGKASFRTAAMTILVADVTMSLDNVLAIGAAANGNFLPMAFGLLLSIGIIVCGSALVAELMTRFTWLLDLAALVLAWTSATMMRDDLETLISAFNNPSLKLLNQPIQFLHISWLVLLLAFLTCSIIIVFDLFYRRQARKVQQKMALSATQDNHVSAR